jgi:hypothetical protein
MQLRSPEATQARIAFVTSHAFVPKSAGRGEAQLRACCVARVPNVPCRPSIFATTRLKRPGACAEMSSSCTVEARTIGGAVCTGMGSGLPSLLRLVKARRCSVSWHAEHINVRCSKPGTARVSSGTTFIKVIAAPQTMQRIR